jgi:RimJ/RimL family protein N-acetyltransferase
MSTLNVDLLSPTPPLEGLRVRLESLTPELLEPYWRMVCEPEGSRFTGTHRRFTREHVEDWLSTRAAATERADWAILASEDGRFLGEVVLNEIDVDNRSGGFRIILAGPQEYGRGYGTEATRLVVRFALDVVGLHRLGLAVFHFNDRAIATYRRCGFVEEGRLRDALLWDGEWHDCILMSVLATDDHPDVAATPPMPPVE